MKTEVENQPNRRKELEENKENDELQLLARKKVSV